MKRAGLILFALLGLAWAGWQDIPGEFLQRQRVYVTDYGAIPNDGKDDGAAIARLLTAVRVGIAAGQYNQVTLHFPGGVYDFERTNALHPLIQEDGTLASSSGRPPYGINFTGDAQNFTILKLHRDNGNPRWFYDSGANAAGVQPGWNRCQFEHLWFQSDQSSYDPTTLADVNGFRLCATTASGGVDKWFISRNCRHDFLGTPLQFTGSSNTDSYNAYSCGWNQCGPIIIENDQSLAHSFYGCHFWCADDVFWMKNTAGQGGQGQGGGGQISLHTCDIIQANVLGDTDLHYTVRIDDGAAFYRTWVFDNCQWEFRNPESCLLKWPGTASFLTGSQITFRDCNLSIAQQGSASYGGGGFDTGYTTSSLNGSRVMISMGAFKRAVFERCIFADQLAIEFTDVNTGSVVGHGHQPIVEMRGCQLSRKFLSGLNDAETADEATRGLQNRITQSNGYGRVIATDCYLRDASSTAGTSRMAVDFDYGARQAVLGEPGVRRKRVYLLTGTQGWPTSGSTRKVLLPYGAKVVAAGFDSPTSGTQSATTYYQIANDDGTFIYTRSTQYRADAEHHGAGNEFSNPGVFPRIVTSVNERFVELSQPTGNAVTKTGGAAWVEYE
jgi:hypothetical protein